MADYRIQDTFKEKSGSRLDNYWDERGFEKFYKGFRRGIDLPKNLAKITNSAKEVGDKYKLRGFQFGNWLTMEDRYNYLAAFFVCLYDLNKVLKFKGNNLGLDNHLGVAFGARGKSRAVAHYEPWSDIINMTRYQEIPGASKKAKFLYTGGVGSFAHEYGHFLDYHFGANFITHGRVYSISGGSSASRVRYPYTANHKARIIMEDILEKAYWKSKGKESNFYKRIREYSNRKYFVQRNEIFARLFEQYIQYKLKERGIKNSFLTDTKYDERIYMRKSELEKVVPLMDALVREFRGYF